MSSRPSTPPSASGEILAGACYHRTELKRRLGWSDSAIRSAIQRGMPMHRAGKQQFAIGAEIIAWITQQPLVGQPVEAGRHD